MDSFVWLQGGFWRGAWGLLGLRGEGEEEQEAQHLQELAQQQEQAHGDHLGTALLLHILSWIFTSMAEQKKLHTMSFKIYICTCYTIDKWKIFISSNQVISSPYIYSLYSGLVTLHPYIPYNLLALIKTNYILAWWPCIQALILAPWETHYITWWSISRHWIFSLLLESLCLRLKVVPSSDPHLLSDSLYPGPTLSQKIPQNSKHHSIWCLLAIFFKLIRIYQRLT